MRFVCQRFATCRKSLRNVRSRFARLQQRRYTVCCLREPTELARRIFLFLSTGKTRRVDGEETTATAWPITLIWAGHVCRVFSNQSSTAAADPHVGSEFQTAKTGCSPITPARDIHLDADWLTVFHRVPSLITFSPLLLTLLLPERKGAAQLIKHNPAM